MVGGAQFLVRFIVISLVRLSVKEALIRPETDPAVFKGCITGKTATILIHQALLSGHEAFCAGGSLLRDSGGKLEKTMFAVQRIIADQINKVRRSFHIRITP